MIAFVHGTVADVTLGSAVLEVGGVGLHEARDLVVRADDVFDGSRRFEPHAVAAPGVVDLELGRRLRRRPQRHRRRGEREKRSFHEVHLRGNPRTGRFRESEVTPFLRHELRPARKKTVDRAPE